MRLLALLALLVGCGRTADSDVTYHVSYTYVSGNCARAWAPEELQPGPPQADCARLEWASLNVLCYHRGTSEVRATGPYEVAVEVFDQGRVSCAGVYAVKVEW